MKKQRKLIGVIIGQVAGSYQSQLLAGICDTAFPHNYDVAVFSMFVKQWAKPIHQVGEKNIYNLINYELFDGIIIVPDTLQLPGLLDQIYRDIRERFDGPVVSIDYKLDGCINLCMDDLNSIKQMINHLIDIHKVTNFAILSGPKDHPHSIRRLEGVLHEVRSHGIPITEEQIYYGDFWFESGKKIAQDLSKLPCLPEALVCLNESMAISVCDAFISLGIRVPHDIIVTGYDTLHLGKIHNPSITSMELHTEKLGKKAMFEIIQVLEKTLLEDIDTLAVLSIKESCGCNANNSMPRDYTPYADTEYRDPFYSTYNYMMEELMSMNDLNSLLEQISHYTYLLNDFNNFYLALCDNWDYVGCSYEASQNYNIDHYTSKMHLKITKGKKSGIYNDSTFPVSIMIPSIWEEREKPSVYHFNPVHFGDRCFGYTVLEFKNPEQSLDICFRDWIRYVGTALENLRVKNNFIWSNQQLEEYAQVDGLTKIFNRNGYTKFSESFFEAALREDNELFIIMGDLNDLKGINDNFGHLEGDNAIQLCAVAFQRTCSQTEKCFRYGGDEFILLGVNRYSKTDILLFEKGIQSYLKAYNEVSEKPYSVTISLGYWHGKVDSQHSLDDYVMLADKSMFDAKERDKKKRKPRV